MELGNNNVSPLRSEHSSSSPSISKSNNRNRRRHRKVKSANATTTTTTTSAGTTMMMMPSTTHSPPPPQTTKDFDDFFTSPKKTNSTPSLNSNFSNSSNNNYSNNNNNNAFQDNHRHNNNRTHHHQHHHHHNNSNNSHHHHKSGKSHNSEPADMTVIVNRVDLWDAASKFITPDEQRQQQLHVHPVHCSVAPYHFAPDVSCWLSSSSSSSSTTSTPSQQHPTTPYYPSSSSSQQQQQLSVAAIRVPYLVKFKLADPNQQQQQQQLQYLEQDDHQELSDQFLDAAVLTDHPHRQPVIIDTSTPNPHGSIVDKYWAQRRRLFSRFDMGIQMDEEGWYSVTPEIIADHVALRVGECSNSAAFSRGLPGSRINDTQGIVVLDAFCGCGGNSIAFGKIAKHKISLVVCVDIDRTKLRKAAHNASLYDIPKDKLIFVECNTMFILQHCYKNGDFVLDQPSAIGSVMPCMPSPVKTEVYAGFMMGGLDVLPRRIDAVFMDPPWGGVDYEVLGKNGYNLFLNMKIRLEPGMQPETNEPPPSPPLPTPPTLLPQPVTSSSSSSGGGGISDDFFDSFGGGNNNNKKKYSSSSTSSSSFNNSDNDANKKFVNGAELLKLAAAATTSRLVIYDLPRNTNKNSLGQAALDAGYRGNIKLEEHWLNGRLKTVTAYFGADYSNLLRQDAKTQPPSQPESTSLG